MASGLGRPYIFEISVYYESREKHIARVKEAKAQYLEQFERFREQDPAFYQGQSDHFDERLACPWDFNQIVGAIGLYPLGNQIRGALHFADLREFDARQPKPSLSRNNRKPLIEYGKIWESDEFTNYSSAQIYDALLEELKTAARTDTLLKSRHLDLGPFVRIGPHVDWRAALEAARKPR